MFNDWLPVELPKLLRAGTRGAAVGPGGYERGSSVETVDGIRCRACVSGRGGAGSRAERRPHRAGPFRTLRSDVEDSTGRESP